MRMCTSFFLIGIFAWVTAETTSYAAEPHVRQLASKTEFETQYKRSLSSGNARFEVFSGGEKSTTTSLGQADTVCVFDRQNLTVLPLMSESIQSQLTGMSGMLNSLSIDAAGKNVIACPSFPDKSGAASLCSKIIAIETNSLTARCLVDDGQRNYATSISPNGKYVAYYATDPTMDVDPEKIISHSAGRILDIESGKVQTCLPPFLDKGQWLLHAPSWLDDTRVVFCSLTTDAALIKANAKEGCSTTIRPYAALVNATNSSLAQIVFPFKGKYCLPPEILVDEKNKTLYFSTEQSVIKTNFDMTECAPVVQVEPPERIVPLGLNGGEFKFKIKGK